MPDKISEEIADVTIRTPLYDIIHNIVLEHGTISLGAYMSLCLGHPQHGYYMTKEPFGAHGDFTTAPEISQLFGEMVALWVMTKWQELGEPSEIQLVEFGPGRGTLMRDVWRGLSAMPNLRDRLSLHLIEFSPRLQAIQQETLYDLPVTWHTEFATIPQKTSLIFANEFFDALPVEQAVYQDGLWYQRVIAAEEEDILLTLGKPLQGITAENAEDGDVYEYAPAMAGIMEEICAFLRTHRGAFLTFDYGDEVPVERRIGDTIQAVRQHKPIGILERPGESDITAHVSFDALSRMAEDFGCDVAPILTQREFLTQFGIRLRAEKLAASANDNQSAELLSGLQRLVDPAQMGDLFKVLQVTFSQESSA